MLHELRRAKSQGCGRNPQLSKIKGSLSREWNRRRLLISLAPSGRAKPADSQKKVLIKAGPWQQ